MADRPERNETRSALVEAADRFDRLARVVKDQQLSETRSGSRIALSDSYTASPDEAWAKKFMTQAIGPAPTNPVNPAATSLGVPAMPGFPPLSYPDAMSREIKAASVLAPAVPAGLEFSPAAPATGRATIGSEIGKPRRKRSWLGRMLVGASS